MLSFVYCITFICLCTICQTSAWVSSPQSFKVTNTIVLTATSDGGEYSKDEELLESLPPGRESESVAPKPPEQLRRQAPPKPEIPAGELMRAMGTSPRRILLSGLSATGIALAGNFLGVTSRLLTAVPEDTVEATGLDTYFPRGDFKRCRSKGYTFVIPKEWVADTYVELAKAQRQTQPLDYGMKRQQPASSPGTLPDSAYGPPGRLNQKGVSESGDINVSVIVSPGFPGFTLKGTLGSPTSAAETLLRVSLAPEGSGRVATLIKAEEDLARGVYQFEYAVDRGAKGPPLRNISVVAASRQGEKLYTLTVVAPQREWEKEIYAAKLRKIAESFHLTTSASGTQ